MLASATSRPVLVASLPAAIAAPLACLAAAASKLVWLTLTACASSGECLEMSDSAEAATAFRLSSGSWTDSTSSGTAPAAAHSSLGFASAPHHIG